MVLFQLVGCKPTRWVDKGDYLLQKNHIEIDNNTIDKKELEAYYRQQPNKRFLLVLKFHLAAYNFSKIGKDRKWKKWIRRVIGEEPSVYDPILVERTKEQFEKFLKNEAYYNSKVSYDVNFSEKRAWVNYQIQTGEPIYINNLNYRIEDSLLYNILMSDTANSFLSIGERMIVSKLENERNRIITQVRDSGYFKFNQENIHYEVDTFNRKANISLVVEKAIIRDSLNNLIKVPHNKYWINKVYFLPDFDPQNAIRNRNTYFQTFDTTYYRGFGFIYPGKENIKPKTILKANTIFPGQAYNYTKANGTLKYLNSLRLFRLNNLNFYQESSADSLINCVVQLTPSVYQDFSVNFETTNTQGNFGIGGFFNYQHKNLFRGAEVFNFRVSGLLQRQSATKEKDAFNIYEYGAEMSLQTPSFILPFRMARFYKKYNPKTNFSVSYNLQKRPEYERIIYNTSMGYDWKGSKTVRHIINPIDISSVYVDASQKFQDSISGRYLENSYKDYLIAGTSYSFFYQDNDKKSYQNFSYYRWNIGTAGNLLYLLHNTAGFKDTVAGGYYSLFKLQYAQFISTDFDYRYSYYLNKDNSIIGRAFGGIAIPYGNSKAIPFVRQFYSGGAEGIRAWHAKDLGPGVFSDSSSTYPNQMSDIKIEFNLEYRYNLNRSWKGAFFVDIGNIWAIREDNLRKGADFKFDQFYKQFAIGTGFGIRYDLNFAVFRIDWGIKVRDPSKIGNNEWILFDKDVLFNDKYVWHFAVGYPF